MDLILMNGSIHTLDRDNNLVEAVAIKDGKIYGTGSTEEMLKLRDNNTKIMDLKNKAAFPGFNDSHMHLLNYAYSMKKADLIATDSIEDLKNRMTEYMEDKDIKEGEWLLGRGWNHDKFSGEKIFPDRYDLDEISTLHPILVTRTCGHVASINSKALEIIGISKASAQIEGGHFDLDEDGEPVGIFRENALSHVNTCIPSPNTEEIKEMLVEAVESLSKCGITSIGSDDLEALADNDYKKVLRAFKELKDQEKLNVRVYEQCLLANLERYKEFLKSGYRTGDGDYIFKIGPLKILLDGSLGARTAALKEAYRGQAENLGILMFTQEELDQMTQLANNNDCQIAIHGIGDRAIEMGLNSIERALEKKPRADHRHGIVHSQLTNKYIFYKYVKLNALAYIQPIFLDYDWSIVEDRIGIERSKTSYNWKTMVEMGIHCPMGSDCPVEPFNVMHGIYEAVTRKDLKGRPEEGWMIDQALSLDQAIYGYTVEGAYASFEEDVKGRIEEGMLADIVVLNQNPYKVKADDIKDISVNMTIMGGKIVYNSSY